MEVNLPFTLLCENALTALENFDAQSVDLIFADPPYFLSNGGFTVKSGKMASVNKGDWDSSQGFQDEIKFHRAWITECLRVLKPNGSLFVSGTYHSIYKCGFLLQEQGARIVNDISWFKPNGAPALAGRNFTASHENLIWATRGPSSKHTFNYPDSKKWSAPSDLILREGKQMRSVWSIPTTPSREKLLGKHPTQKPVELLDRIISLCSNVGDLVLDPFCGSGTTGVVSISRGRKFIGIDLDASYIELSRGRISQAYEAVKNT
jgi:site-specific DNA-methyltransferase (adenine-specific)